MLKSFIQSPSYMPQWALFSLDLFICAIAILLSHRIGDALFFYQINFKLTSFVILLFIQAVSFLVFNTYSGILRFSTFMDTIKVLEATATTSLAALFINMVCRYSGMTTEQEPFLNTNITIYFLVAFLFLFCLRVSAKTLYEVSMHKGINRERILIYDTESSGLALAKMMNSDVKSKYQVMGFIGEKNGSKHKIYDLKVYGMDDSLLERIKSLHVSSIIITANKLKQIDPTNDLAIFMMNGINIRYAPNIVEWGTDDEKEKKDLRYNINTIKIEDLLQRPIIDIDTENVASTVADKVVMITGAAGSIGSELVRQIMSYKPSLVVLFDQAESPLHDLTLDLHKEYPKQSFVAHIGDVRNCDRVKEIMEEYKPNVIYHAAAYKHVPLMESHPNEAVLANVLGSKNVADLAVKYGVERFVMISTDKAVNPTNVMGASKRIAEIYVQSFAKSQTTTRFTTTRFGNVLGSNGSVIPYFKKQIAEGGPVTVTHPDIIRYFMTIPEACTLVMEASTLGKGGEIFVFDMGQPVKILDLAKNMIRLAGLVPNEDIMIEFTGLRPGEKLYEELLNQKETTLPTANKRIMVAKVREYDFNAVKKEIDELIETAQSRKPFLTVKKMKEIVPEFKSKNSQYEALDK